MKKFLKFIGVVLLAGFFAVTLTGCTPEQAQYSSQNTEVKAPVVEVKTEIKNEAIPFFTTNENDPTLITGLSKIKQEGQDGKKEITYKVTYTDGKETAREKVTEKVVTEPVNKIVLIGTKVPTVDGNYVQPLSNDPAGATAKRRDGTYSYSQHWQGTCSHHGGVAQWL